jgi:hypothetical protein
MRITVMDGKEIVARWKAWCATPEGAKCLGGVAEGKYLRNRLELAFHAGIEAAELARNVARKTP